ncbi:hypothetical protein L0Y65_01565 [Candidatus Micrarchaeota archaeon]|nr:hypothetical protein [Candidatus Micrarchaeota archaeon]
MRKSDSSAKNVPQISMPASSSAFRNAKAGTPTSRPPEIQSVSRADALAQLKGTAAGWDRELEGLFAMPERLYKLQGDSATYYSKNESFGLGEVLDGLSFGKLPRELPEYGFCLYSSGGAVHFALVDGVRNFVVHARLFSIHDQNPEKDWGVVKEAIRSALTLSADARKQGAAAVYDGMLSAMRLG